MAVGAVSSRGWSVSRGPGWGLPGRHHTPLLPSLTASAARSACRAAGLLHPAADHGVRAVFVPVVLLASLPERSTSIFDTCSTAGASSARRRPSKRSPCSETSTVASRSHALRGVDAGPHDPVVRRRRCDAVLSSLHGQAFPLVVSHVAASACCTHPPCGVWAAGVCCRVPRPQGLPPRADPLRPCRVATTRAPDAPLGLSVLQRHPSRGVAAQPPGGDCGCAVSMGRAVLPGPVRRGVRCPNRGGRGHSSRGCGRTGRPLRRAGPGPRSPSGAQRTVVVTSKSARDARRASR